MHSDPRRRGRLLPPDGSADDAADDGRADERQTHDGEADAVAHLPESDDRRAHPIADRGHRVADGAHPHGRALDEADVPAVDVADDGQTHDRPTDPCQTDHGIAVVVRADVVSHGGAPRLAEADGDRPAHPIARGGHCLARITDPHEHAPDAPPDARADEAGDHRRADGIPVRPDLPGAHRRRPRDGEAVVRLRLPAHVRSRDEPPHVSVGTHTGDRIAVDAGRHRTAGRRPGMGEDHVGRVLGIIQRRAGQSRYPIHGGDNDHGDIGESRIIIIVQEESSRGWRRRRRRKGAAIIITGGTVVECHVRPRFVLLRYRSIRI